jgi:hypothetical protein
MSVYQVQTQMTSLEITEWAAYFLTQDKGWREAQAKKRELEESRKMTSAQKAEKLKGMLKGTKKSGNNRKSNR